MVVQTFYTRGDKPVVDNLIEELEAERDRIEGGFQSIFNLLGGGGSGQQRVATVDPANGDNATGAFGTAKPFKTIQAALSAVPAATDAATSKQVHVIVIAPNDYDEDLAIDLAGKRIILTSWGPWNLGTFNAVDWGPSGTRRNITITGAGASINGIRTGFAIMGTGFGEGLTTHESYLTRPRISGKIDLSGMTGSVELLLACEIFGNGGVSVDGGAVIVQSYLYNCRMRGSLGGANWNFQIALSCRFDGLVTVNGYSQISLSRFTAGLTTATAPAAGIFPSGFIATNFAGTFTGPAGSLHLDGNSNYWFKTNGALLAGGATKVIEDDLVP